MNKLVFAVIGGDSYLFDSLESFNSFTFAPELGESISFFIELSIKGNTYAERKERARNLAKEIQLNDNGGLSWGESSQLCDFFENVGARYGLLKEFKENGII